MSYIHWLRRRIGREKTILVYSTIVLRDAMGRILLQQRSDFAWWGMPGGILECGEDILTCAHRELGEETGLEAADLQLVGVYTHPRYDVVYPNGDEVQQFSVCFTGQVNGGSLRPDGEEILSLEFVDPDTLAQKQVPAWYRAMIVDSRLSAKPAFDWDATLPSVPSEPNAAQSTLWALEGYILPASVAVLQRDDGKLYWPVGLDGQRGFPALPMSLGETAASTAARALALPSDAFLLQPRLLGVVSRPRWLGNMSSGTDHVVATVFLLDGASALRTSDQTDWFAPTRVVEAARVEQVAFYEQVVNTLGGGYFVDERWGNHV